MYSVGEMNLASFFSLLYKLVAARNIRYKWTLSLGISKSSVEIRQINKIIIILCKCSHIVHIGCSRKLVEGQLPNSIAGGEGEDQEMLFKERESELGFERSITIGEADMKEKGIHSS